MENVTLQGTNRVLSIHNAKDCSGWCAFHRPVPAVSNDWPMHWREDRGILERICPCHGIGHPDASQMLYMRSQGRGYENVHGCTTTCECGPMIIDQVDLKEIN
jgi:hypothetical protein